MHTTPRGLCAALSNSNPAPSFPPMTFKKAETSSNEASNKVSLRHTRLSMDRVVNLSKVFLASAILFSYWPTTPAYVSTCRFCWRDALLGNPRNRRGPWFSVTAPRHARPSGVLHSRLGLPIPGLSSPSRAGQHAPAGGGHLAAVQRLAVSGLPEKQRQLLRRGGCFAGKYDATATCCYC